jgi:hypothetical protein
VFQLLNSSTFPERKIHSLEERSGAFTLNWCVKGSPFFALVFLSLKNTSVKGAVKKAF